MTVQSIGFIGLGLLGSAIARRLMAKGHAVSGFDIDAAKIDATGKDGLIPAASPAALAASCDVLLLCVTSSAAVAEVIGGAQGVLSAGRLDGKVLVDHSTTDIDLTRQLAQQLQDSCGIAMVDAPVSGGPDAAASGTLSIMAGGETQALDRITPLMADLGRFTAMGAVGAGQATKLVNQSLVLPTYCLMAEALRLAQAYGVDATRIPHALELGHAGSNLLPILFERMINEDFEPRGYARQILKDLEMLHTAAKDQHLAMPMASQALTMFRMLVAQGNSELDGAAVVSLLPDVSAAPDA